MNGIHSRVLILGLEVLSFWDWFQRVVCRNYEKKR